MPIVTAKRLPGAGGGSPPTDVTWAGVSDSSATPPGGIDHCFAQWDAVRKYSTSSTTLTDMVNTYSPKVLLLSDDSGISKTGGQTSANTLNSRITSFYSNPAHADIGFWYCNGNECDVVSATKSRPAIGPYTTTMAAMRDVVDQWQANGYPVKLGFDATQSEIRDNTNPTADYFQPIAVYLDFIGCSDYPPGRNKTPAQTSPLTDFIDPKFDLALAWGVGEVQTWEIGTPLSTLYDRPSYIQTWIDRNMLLRDTYGIKVPAMAYWDNWKGTSSDPDNRFQGDCPLSAAAWRNGIAAM